MNWLARMEINAKLIRKEGIFDNYVWHKKLWEDCFSKTPNATRDFLTRIDTIERIFRVWISFVQPEMSKDNTRARKPETNLPLCMTHPPLLNSREEKYKAG